MTDKEIQNWSDTAMFKAEEIDEDSGPEVFLLSCNPDPLGSIAAAAKAYKGEFVNSLAEITDDERRYYLAEVQKSVLEMPLELVQFHFRIKGVTRGFTHQMVRQRTAAYAQESTRFAVKEDVPVGRPPSLQGTVSWSDWMFRCFIDLFPALESPGQMTEEQSKIVGEYAEQQASKAQLWRRKWDAHVAAVDYTYNDLVNDGMPAEDARGLLPTNLLTQINYITDLRGLKGHAGVRLCTQAQFEWRLVWAQIIKAIKDFGRGQVYSQPDIDTSVIETGELTPDRIVRTTIRNSQWQFDALADVFRPICYYRGSCQFQADFDRHCTIRGRVEDNAEIGRKSDRWGQEYDDGRVFIGAIQTREWLADPAAARVK